MPRTVIRPEDVRAAIAPDGWLGFAVRDDLGAPVPSSRDPEAAEAMRFLATRGLGSETPGDAPQALARTLIDLDRRSLAQGLSLLLANRATEPLRPRLPPLVEEILAEDRPRLDHVGIEVFGRLEKSLETLADWETRGLLSLAGVRIFPSVQVRSVLARGGTPADVRVARVFLHEGDRLVNVELFEVAQPWTATLARKLALFADMRRIEVTRLARQLAGSVEFPVDPVEHIALGVENPRTVQRVGDAVSLSAPDGRDTRLYDGRPSFNSDDQSLNIQFLLRTGTLGGHPVFGLIVELICYDVAAVSAAQPVRTSDR